MPFSIATGMSNYQRVILKDQWFHPSGGLAARAAQEPDVGLAGHEADEKSLRGWKRMSWISRCSTCWPCTIFVNYKTSYIVPFMSMIYPQKKIFLIISHSSPCLWWISIFGLVQKHQIITGTAQAHVSVQGLDIIIQNPQISMGISGS